MKKVHLSLAVTDIAASRAFYSVLFDTPPSKEKVDYLKFEPRDLALNISFSLSASGAAEPERHHLGIEVDSTAALDALHERLLTAGLVSDRRVASVCCYAEQDKFHAQDPSGYRWELYRLLEDTEIKRKDGGNCCVDNPSAGTCCA